MFLNKDTIQIKDYKDSLNKEVGGINIPLDIGNEDDFRKEVKKYVKKVLEKESRKIELDNTISVLYPTDELAKNILSYSLQDAKRDNQKDIEDLEIYKKNAKIITIIKLLFFAVNIHLALAFKHPFFFLVSVLILGLILLILNGILKLINKFKPSIVGRRLESGNLALFDGIMFLSLCFFILALHIPFRTLIPSFFVVLILYALMLPKILDIASQSLEDYRDVITFVEEEIN